MDIEHTNGKRYFTWDADKFPNPKAMAEKLEAQGRHIVTIVDPHVKKEESYDLYRYVILMDLKMKTFVQFGS